MPLVMPQMGEVSVKNKGKKCLALDLDETLVHSSFQPVEQAHYVIPVNIEGIVHNVFVIKRPGLKSLKETMTCGNISSDDEFNIFFKNYYS